MNCNKCGILLTDQSEYCKNCGNQVVIKHSINKTINNKRNFIIIGIVIISIIILGIILGFVISNKRKVKLTNIEEFNYVKYKYGKDELYLGKSVSDYISKGYSYDTKNITKDDYILGDSISMMTFYKDDEPKFLGALYCSKNDRCSFSEATLVKINFYENEKLLIDDFLKYGISYEDVVQKYGKEEGVFYQNNEQLVWTFGKKGKIGEPYYVLRFDNGGLFSTGDLIDIRIGVWWYDGEYDHTVIKNNSKGDF